VLLMDRPVISDGRAGKPARPDVGTASGAYGPMLAAAG
jgi:hypothetical protein